MLDHEALIDEEYFRQELRKHHSLRIRFALAKARARGTILGRPPTDPAKLANAVGLYNSGSYKTREACESLSVLYRALRKQQQLQA